MKKALLILIQIISILLIAVGAWLVHPGLLLVIGGLVALVVSESYSNKED